MILTVITSNPGKVREYESSLSHLGIEMVHEKVPYMEPQVDTLREVVESGLQELRSQGMSNFIIDDSGIFVDALRGFPGVYSAYALRTLGNEGILRLMDGVEDRKADFRCCIGCSIEGEEDIMVEGRCDGIILRQAVGSGGFGFDPIFSPDGGRSFAQMPIGEKNEISHRGRAVAALVKELEMRRGIN